MLFLLLLKYMKKKRMPYCFKEQIAILIVGRTMYTDKQAIKNFNIVENKLTDCTIKYFAIRRYKYYIR